MEESMSRVIKKTNCRLCAYLCGLTAVVDDGRILKLEPDPTRYPYNASIMLGCRRCQSNLGNLDHEQRLNYPLKRIGNRGSGQWMRISWDDALDEIAEKLYKLKEIYGPETLSTSIGGPHTDYWPLHRFMNLFGSPNNIGIGQICWNPAIWVNTITFGWPIENELEPEITKCVILWGTNPAESDNSLFWRTIKLYARDKGKLIVIDPRYSRAAAHANRWLSIQPGTDSALALGLIHIILAEDLYDHQFVNKWCRGFETLQKHVTTYNPEYVSQITGLSTEDIVETARIYATNKPAYICHGRGIDQIGRNSIHTHRALAILKAITGNIDLPGATQLLDMPDFMTDIDLELTDRLSEVHRQKQLGNNQLLLQTYKGYERITQFTVKAGKRLPARYLSSAHPNLVWRAMLTGEPYSIRAMIVDASNPLLSQADTRLIYEALKSLDLLVVLDLYLTPTGMLADYILPMAGGIERPVIQTNSGVANIAFGGQNAIPPLYERRVDFDFWRDLGIRLGQEQDWPWQTYAESLDTIFAPLGIGWQDFCETGLYYPPHTYRKFENINSITGEAPGFATPSGKIELYSELLKEINYCPLPIYVHNPVENKKPYTLTLITGARKQPYYASAFRQIESLRKIHPLPEAEVDAETAKALGIANGDVIWVETSNGRACFISKTTKMRANVVSIEYGWWYPECTSAEPELGGLWFSNANILTNADFECCEPLLGQWALNGIPCQIYLADESEIAHFKDIAFSNKTLESKLERLVNA
jgi:thiosulfate reductase/polysulfide reductase chain A